MQGMGIGGAYHAARRQDELKRMKLQKQNHKKTMPYMSQKNTLKDIYMQTSVVNSEKVNISLGKNDDSFFEDSKQMSPMKQSMDENQQVEGKLNLNLMHLGSGLDTNHMQGTERSDMMKSQNLSKTQQLLLGTKQEVVFLKKSALFRYHGKQNLYDKRSLFILNGDNPIRKVIVWLVDWKYFEYFILVMILLNSLALVLYDYSDRNSETQWNQYLDIAGTVFTVIFAVECGLKILAYGFIIHRKAYLRLGWNILDFGVVISGILETLPGSVRLKSLRVLRVLRPLRSINAIPSMKKHVTALIQSIPDFFNVVIFLLFIFILFAILGTHQYQGIFYNECRFNRQPETPNSWLIDMNQTRVCTKTGQGLFTYDHIGNFTAINYGITNFDDLASSLLSVFQIVSTDAWSVYMFNLMDADVPFVGAAYCILMVVIGAFFLMNLILAVIIQAFIKIQKRELDEEFLKLEDKKQDKDQLEILEEVAEFQDQAATRAQPHDQNQDETVEIKQDWDQNYSAYPKSDLADSRQNLATHDNYANENTNYNKDYDTQSKLKNSNSSMPTLGMTILTSRGFGKRVSQEETLVPPNLQETLPNPQSLLSDRRKSRIQEMTEELHALHEHDEPKTVKSHEGVADLSFLRPIAMKRKVANIFSKQSNSNTINRSPIHEQVHEHTHEDEDTDQQKKLQFSFIPSQALQLPLPDTARDQQPKSESPPKRKNLISNFLAELADRKIDAKTNNQDQDIEPDTHQNQEQSKLQLAFSKFLEKQRTEKQSQQEYFNNLLQETKQNYEREKEANQPSSLRQLASLRLGIKIKRQKADLSKEYRRFKSEYRAEKNKVFKIAFRISQNKLFTSFISLSIVLNTVILSLDSYPEDDNLNFIYEWINTGFSLVFIAEMLIKLVALGLKAYFIDAFNTFDCIVVFATVIDLFVSNLLSYESGGAFTALRAFRLLRIFKLAKSWKKLQQLLKTIWKTLKDVSTFSILLFLFMFVYSLLGMEMFAYKAKFDALGFIDMENGIDPPQNFNEFLEAFTTVFIVLTNDGWSSIYFNYYRTAGGIISTIFFISLIVIGQKILLNLFLAILLENFDEDSLNQEIKAQFKEQEQMKNELTKIERFIQWAKDKLMDFFSLNQDQNQSAKFQGKVQGNSSGSGNSSSFANLSNTVRIQASTLTMTPKSNPTANERRRRKRLKDSKQLSSIDNNVYVEGKSLYLFGMENWFRQLIFDIVTNMKFDYLIIFFIILSAVQLALENPLNDPNGVIEQVLFYIDTVSTAVFSLEAFLKIIAFGFIFNGRPSYLRNPWNMLDFVIIIFSILSLTPLVGNLKIIKIFRVARPLRLISRNKGLKVAVKALAQAIPSIANVTIITLLFFVIFGIIAISYFKGKFFVCNIANVDTAAVLTIQTKWDCFNAGGTWQNSPYSFDNILDASQTMFQMATTSGWSTIMYTSMSSTDIDYVLVNKNNPYWSLFFIVFIIVGAFFLLNLFVGVVISTFNREKDKIGGNNLLTDQQKEWIDTRLLVINSKPMKKLKPPNNSIRRICFLIQENRFFDLVIFVCILLNTLILCLKWYDQPNDLDFSTDVINYIFTFIFTLEAFIKIMALDKLYFKDGWNIFDFTIVIGSIASVFLTLFTTLSIGGATTIIRAFRISRVFRLIKKAQSLRMVFNTFIVTLPALANVGGLLLLLLYLYSVLGVYLFAEVKRNGIMNDVLNYESFWNAFITLFIVATGDSWDQIMDSSTQEMSITYQCQADPTYQDYVKNGEMPVGCGIGAAAHLFYYSYILFVNLIFLNLFIAIILQGFEDTQQKETRLFNNDTLGQFRKIWADFDPEATTFIKISQLKPLLFKLGSPLGFDKTFKGSKAKQDNFIINLDLPTYNDFTDYQFLDVLDALSLRLMVKENFEKSKKREEEEEEIKSDGSLEEQGHEIKRMDTKQKEEKFKNQIIQDINKLKFSEGAQGIDAVQQVQIKENKMQASQKNVNKDNYFTSLHQAAAEVAFNHMKYVVAKRKLIKKIENMENEEMEYTNQLMQDAQQSVPNVVDSSENSISISNSQPSRHNITIPPSRDEISSKSSKNVLSKFTKPDKSRNVINQEKQDNPILNYLQNEPNNRIIIQDMTDSRIKVRQNTKYISKMQRKKKNSAKQNSNDQSQIQQQQDDQLAVPQDQIDITKSSFSINSILDTSQVEKIIEQEIGAHRMPTLKFQVSNQDDENKQDYDDEDTRRSGSNRNLMRQYHNQSKTQTDQSLTIDQSREQVIRNLNNSNRGFINAQNNNNAFGGSMGGTGEYILTNDYEEEKQSRSNQMSPSSRRINNRYAFDNPARQLTSFLNQNHTDQNRQHQLLPQRDGSFHLQRMQSSNSRNSKSDISQLIQEELTRMLSIPKNKQYLERIEEAEDQHELENIKRDLYSNDNFMEEIQKVIESKITTPARLSELKNEIKQFSGLNSMSRIHNNEEDIDIFTDRDGDFNNTN